MERLEAIRRIAEADAGGATLRLRPFIIGISTPSYLDIIREAGERGAGALSTEFLCVERRSPELRENMYVFNRICGFDLMEFYRRYSVSQGYLRLNRRVKEPFVRRMKEACDRYGMRFYVSDAHFKELCCNGSCCGLPESWNYSRGQFCEALQIAKRNGTVRWKDISADIESLHGSRNSINGINAGSSERAAKFQDMTIADVMRYYWNNPQAGQSPYKMFEGIVVPDGKDEDGNLIYKYNGKK